jgi:hypothetical protein
MSVTCCRTVTVTLYSLERCREAEAALYEMRWYELTLSVHFFDKSSL